MNDIFPDFEEELKDLDESEKLDYAFNDMELLYKSRCVDVPLDSNVTVVEIDKKE